MQLYKQQIQDDGMYSIEADNLPYEQFNRMKEILCEDFYLLSQIKELYKEAFPNSDESQINPYTIKTLGFKVYSGYTVARCICPLDYLRPVKIHRACNPVCEGNGHSMELAFPSADQ